MNPSRLAGLSSEQRAFLAARLQEAVPGISSKQLVAWIRHDATIETADIREFAGAHLPAARVPRHFASVESLPRTSSGKIDRRKLSRIINTAEVRTAAEKDDASPLERELKMLWEKVLSLKDAGSDDNFFHMGGDSLGTIQLVALAQERGLSVTPSLVHENPTIRTLAAAIRISADGLRRPTDNSDPKTQRPRFAAKSEVSPQFRSAVNGERVHGPIQLSAYSDKPYLFLLPPMGNQVGHFWSLIVEMSAYTCFAPVTPSDDVVWSQTIEELASDYLRQIRSIQPDGPFRFAGFCEGAYAAWEITRRLREQGEEVRFLGLIDTANPDGLKPVRETFAAKTRRRINSIRTQATSGLMRHLVSRTSGWVRRRLRKAVTGERHLTLGGKRMPWLFHPCPIPGQATLLRVLKQSEIRAFETDISYGWGALAQGGLDIRFVPGDRLSFLTPPNAAILADRLEQAVIQHDSVFADSHRP